MKPRVVRAYLQVWLKLTVQQFQSQVANARGAAALFIFGKLFRLSTAFLMVYIIVGKAQLIAGYTLNQAILILALFNLASSISQMFMRGIYMFRQKVVDGTFDFYLLNPLSELFYSLFSYTDPMDLILLFPYLGLTVWAWLNSAYPFTLSAVLFVLLVLAIAQIMIVSWHIIILGVGIRYLEVDNTIMLYRDLEKMAGFPVGMYGKVGSIFLTYVFPFGLMATIPANLIFSLFNPANILIFIVLALIQLKLALLYWRRSLLTYSSASS